MRHNTARRRTRYDKTKNTGVKARNKLTPEEAERRQAIAKSYDRTIVQRLILERRRLGLSQEAVASAIGLTYQQVQKYEKSINRFSPGRLFQIADFMGVPVETFFDQLTANDPHAPISLSKKAVEIAQAYDAIIDAHIQNQFLALGKSLVANHTNGSLK